MKQKVPTNSLKSRHGTPAPSMLGFRCSPLLAGACGKAILVLIGKTLRVARLSSRPVNFSLIAAGHANQELEFLCSKPEGYRPTVRGQLYASARF